MGLTTGQDGTFLMIRGLKKDGSDGRVRFQKGGDENPALDTPVNQLPRKLEGDFKGVTFKDKPWVDEKGKERPRRVFSIKLQDGEETFILGCAFNSIGRNILNSLIGKKEHGRLVFSLYEKEGKPRIGIFSKDEDTQDDMLSWALSMEESDALVTKTELEDGTIHYGYKRLNEFLEKKASQLTARDIKGETNFSEETERTVEEIIKPTKAKKAKPRVEPEDDEDGLPF